MRFRRHSKSEEDTGIDLTPMLDVVFIMLIFFIVSTSFVKESGLDVNQPQASTAESKEKANILIAIAETGDIWIHKRRIDLRSVRANIERLHAESPEGSVVIQADQKSSTGILVEVMDQVRMAGVKNVSIAAKSLTN